MSYSHDLHFQTLLVIPNSAKRLDMTSSRHTLIVSWEDLRDRPGSVAGHRFNQVIATDAPFAEWQKIAWHDLHHRMVPGGKMHIL